MILTSFNPRGAKDNCIVVKVRIHKSSFNYNKWLINPQVLKLFSLFVTFLFPL